MNRGPVAIIGAGFAGLACAAALADAGVEAVVFDKARGPGGRASTRRVATVAGEAAFDHGAQYATARDPAFADWLSQARAAGCADVWTGRLFRQDLAGRRAPLAEEALWVGRPGMNALVRHLASGRAVHWGTRVAGLSGAAGDWRLTDEAGALLAHAAHVVVAIPPEQAVALLAPIAPDLAGLDLAGLAPSAPSLPCWAGLFAFDGPFDPGFDALKLDSDPVLDMLSLNRSKPGRTGPPTLVAHARADWSTKALEAEPATVLDALRVAVQRIIAPADWPPEAHAAAHRWRYARATPPPAAPPEGFVHQPEAGLSLAGDWLIAPRVEAAWLSGSRLGSRLAAAGR